jgi:signal transduction histidine kinase
MKMSFIEEIRPFLDQVAGLLNSSNLKDRTEKTLIELERSQAELSQSERKTSINQLASHVAHEVNNPLNYIATGLISLEDSFKENTKTVLDAVPESDESKDFLKKIKSQYNDINESISQISLGSKRIMDTVSEIRAITGVDGISFQNVSLVKILQQNKDIIVQKAQLDSNTDLFYWNGNVWISEPNMEIRIRSNHYILSRAVRTIFSFFLHFCALKEKSKVYVSHIGSSELDPKIKIDFETDAPIYLHETPDSLFDLKQKKVYGVELIGLPVVKELIKSISGDLDLVRIGSMDQKFCLSLSLPWEA